MDRQYLLNNTKIARSYLERFNLLVPDDVVSVECCFLPPYRWKTFYAQLFYKNGVCVGNCALTSYADYFGLRSVSQSFVTAESQKGDIICKVAFFENNIIQTLTEMIKEYPEEIEPEKGVVVIDGITAGARLYENGKIAKETVIYPSQESPLLDNLVHISEII